MSIILSRILQAIVIISISFDLTASNNAIKLDNEIKEAKEKWWYVYKLSRKRNSEKTAVKYANAIEKFSYIYNLDSVVVANQIFKESKFKRHAKSKRITKTGETNYIAYGPAQIRPKYWGHLLYRVDNGKLSGRLNKITEEQKLYYYHVIEYAVEMQCYIMRYYLDRFEDDYEIALLAYWSGSNSWQFRHWSKKPHKNHYVKDILYRRI